MNITLIPSTSPAFMEVEVGERMKISFPEVALLFSKTTSSRLVSHALFDEPWFKIYKAPPLPAAVLLMNLAPLILAPVVAKPAPLAEAVLLIKVIFSTMISVGLLPELLYCAT